MFFNTLPLTWTDTAHVFYTCWDASTSNDNPSNYLQGPEGIKHCGGKVGLQRSQAAVLEREEQVKVERVPLTGYPKGRFRSGVQVEHVARGSRRGGVGPDRDARLGLAQRGHVEELQCALEAFGGRKGLSHGVQTHTHTLRNGDQETWHTIGIIIKILDQI